MAIKIGSNFTFQGQQPNFERDRFATKAAMKAFPETSIDDGHLSYCAEDGNTYQFKSSNTVDAVTGKWRVFKADVDLSAYATKDDVATDLAKKVDIAGISVYSTSSAKIATIDVPKLSYTVRTISIDIICKQANITTIAISVSTNGENIPAVTAAKTIIGPAANTEKVYYYVDKSNAPTYKVIVYYKNDSYDTVSCRVTGVNVKDIVYSLNMEAIANIPEGAVEIMDTGYGNKNLFYSTPKDTAGNPTFRAIDVADLPDLSSKYATKAEIDAMDYRIVVLHSSLESTQIDFVDLRSKVEAMPKTVFITQAAYNALTTKNSNTIYYING